MKIRDMIAITIGAVLLFTACDPIDDVIKPDRIYGPLTRHFIAQPVVVDNPLNPNDKLLGLATKANEYSLLRDDTLGNVISCTDTEGTLLDSIFLYSQATMKYDYYSTAKVFVIHTDTIPRKNSSGNDTIHLSCACADYVEFWGTADRPYGDKKHNMPTFVFKHFEPSLYGHWKE